MRKKIILVNVPRTPSSSQVYMESFCEAWTAKGGTTIEPSRWKKYRLLRHLMKLMALFRFSMRKNNQAYVICSRGRHLLQSSLPYSFRGEIIPMLWDCWPDTWNTLERDLRLLKCRICFVTASDVVKTLSQHMPQVQFVHIPEGVDTADYQPGPPLADRTIDVYEMGQKHKYFHKKLMDGHLGEHCNFVYNLQNTEKGLLSVFNSWTTFTSKVADSKVIINFPLCMRNPREDGEIDTLTIRYWEAMLSRCVIVGHCPQELIDMIGYNPVIEADFVNPCSQIENILSHIADYQPMVNKNREVAMQHAPWSLRMNTIFQLLQTTPQT